MSADGAECTPTKTTTVHAHRVANHFVGWNALTFIAGVGKTGIGQIKRGVNLFGGHRWIGAVDLYSDATSGLPHVVTVPQVTLYLNNLEILGLGFL